MDNNTSVDQININVKPEGLIFAQNRQFEYRGLWARSNSTKPWNDYDGDGNESTEESDDEEELEDEDDCVTEPSDLYTVRFSNLHGTIMSNLSAKWSDIPIVPLKAASQYVFEFFDHDIWTSGDVKTDTYITSPDCQVIALIGILRTFKSHDAKYTSKQFQKLRMMNVPSRKPTEKNLKTVQLLSQDGEEGVILMSQDSDEILNPDKIITGIPCACIGFVVEGNGFVLCDIVYATPPPCTWPETNKKIEMVFVSGLKFGDGVQETSIELELLNDYLLGLCDDADKNSKPRVFFVGNSFAQTAGDNFDEPSQNELKQLLSAGHELDSFFSNLAKKTEVILIPGDTDPTERVLPQKPFDSSFFPLLCKEKSCKTFQNPCCVEVKVEDEGIHFNIVLSSGSNIDNVKTYLRNESTLSIASKMLEWGHLNPAAKDFYSLIDSIKDFDMFALRDSLPHMYIIGNQEKFMVQSFQTTKIVSLPSFSETRQIASLLRKDDGSYDIVPISFALC